MRQRVLERMGLDGAKTPIMKYQVINLVDSSGVNHHKSCYTNTLMRSRYIMIDDDRERIDHHFKMQNINLTD